jgi:uncharacterized protein YdaU (DUF1376 family)
MSKDPAFLFYSNNFLSGTMLMSDEQVGKYIRLLIAQHQNGHLTENQMMFICKSYEIEIFGKFTKDQQGLFFNDRLEKEIEKRKMYCESRGQNKKGKKKPIETEIIQKSYENHTSILNTQSLLNKENGVLFFELAELEKELLNSGSWIDILCINKKLTVEKVTSLISEFIKTLQNRDEVGKTIKEAKFHFSCWMDMQLEKNPKGIVKKQTQAR